MVIVMNIIITNPGGCTTTGLANDAPGINQPQIDAEQPGIRKLAMFLSQ